MSRRRVTISDVAKLAGVSYQTVSRVVNNKPDVSESTRKRIQKIIKETGYRPSQIARSLVTARTATIGLVVPDISNPFFSAVARGVEQLAYSQGYSILLCNTGEDVTRELDVLHTLHERYVDGVIVCGLRQEDALLQEALANFKAAVLVNRRLQGEPVPAVLVDDELGGYLNTQHLIQMGHTAIGFLAGPAASYSGTQRRLGYSRALADAGIPLRERWITYFTPTVADGETAAEVMLSANPELTALICHNDLMAVGALRYCASSLRRVPEDIAIIGFDDIMLATLVSPPLSTCHVPRVEVGRIAVSMLIEQINDQADPSVEIVIQPHLVIRASTAAPAGVSDDAIMHTTPDQIAPG